MRDDVAMKLQQNSENKNNSSLSESNHEAAIGMMKKANRMNGREQ